MIEMQYPRVPDVYQKLYEFTVVNLGVPHDKANIAVTTAWLGDPNNELNLSNVIQLPLNLHRDKS